MPTNNPPPSSQGSFVTFAGMPIGRLTNECLGIEPGGADVRLRDCPPFLVDAAGMRGVLVVGFATGSFTFDAFLETFDVAGNVGEFLVGTARFRFSGVMPPA